MFSGVLSCRKLSSCCASVCDNKEKGGKPGRKKRLMKPVSRGWFCIRADHSLPPCVSPICRYVSSMCRFVSVQAGPGLFDLGVLHSRAVPLAGCPLCGPRHSGCRQSPCTAARAPALAESALGGPAAGPRKRRGSASKRNEASGVGPQRARSGGATTVHHSRSIRLHHAPTADAQRAPRRGCPQRESRGVLGGFRRPRGSAGLLWRDADS